MLLWTMTLLDSFSFFIHEKMNVEIKDCAKNGNNTNLETKTLATNDEKINGIMTNVNMKFWMVFLVVETT